MNRVYLSSMKETVLQKFALMSSGCTSRVLTSIAKFRILKPVAGCCCVCGRKVSTGKEIIHQEKESLQFLSSSTTGMLLRTSPFSKNIVMDRLYTVSRPCRLSKSSLSLGQTFSASRNYTTSRVLASSAVTSSAISTSSAAASTLAVSSDSSSGLIFPDFYPIFGAEKLIEYIHQLTGLPWWSTIILAAFTVRVVLLIPLTIHSFHNMAKLEKLIPEVTEMAERLKKEVVASRRQFHWTEKRAKLEYDTNLKRQLNELYIRDNCHPMKGVATFWVQMPLWISVTYALRNLSLRAVHPDLDGHMGAKSLSEQGLAWFPDLTVTDGTWLLPVMMGTITLINVEMNYLNIPEITKYRKWLTYGLRGLALVFIPICATMPSSMVLYWVSSSTFGAVQNLLFEYSPFRRLVGLPKSKIESHSPFHALKQKAKVRYLKR